MAVWLRTLGLCLFLVLLTAAVGPRDAMGRDLQLLMALDVSGSMRTTDPQRLLPKAAQIMVDLLGEQDHLGLISFDEETQVRLPLGALTAERRRQGLKELPRLAPRGAYTDLYQVLAESLKLFQASAPERPALLLLTDGIMDLDPEKGDSREFVARVYKEIIPAYQKAGIPIYTVAFTTGSDQALLKELADQTGGQFLLITEARGLHVAFTRFFEALKQPQLAPLLDDHFIIDAGVKEAILIVTRASVGKPVSLTTPDGNRVFPRNIVSRVRWFSSPAFDMVTLIDPEPGKWGLAGHKTGDGKVILITDMKLECPLLPEQAGSDESLMVGAVIMDRDKVVATPEVLRQTTFTAELQREGDPPVSLSLAAPSVEWKKVWPAGAQVAHFPTFNHPGLWRLQVRAVGKTFNRERNYTVKVSSPWYRSQVIPDTRRGGGRLEFLPAPGREPVQLAGWLQVQGLTGGWSGSFLQTPPGGSFSMAWPASLNVPCLVHLELSGVTAAGRPLLLQPAPVRVEPVALAAPESTPPEKPSEQTEVPPPGPAKKKSKLARLLAPISKRWHWFLIPLGAGLLGFGGFFLYRRLADRKAQAQFSSQLAEEIEMEFPEQQKILLLSRIDELQRENARLEMEVTQMTKTIDKLEKEKEAMAHQTADPKSFKEKDQLIRQLESRLGEAEKEAKAVQEEYMALYARSQQEKQELKKG